MTNNLFNYQILVTCLTTLFVSLFKNIIDQLIKFQLEIFRILFDIPLNADSIGEERLPTDSFSFGTQKMTKNELDH